VSAGARPVLVKALDTALPSDRIPVHATRGMAWIWVALCGFGLLLASGSAVAQESAGSNPPAQAPEVILSLDRAPRRVIAEDLRGVSDTLRVVQYKLTDPELVDPLEDLLARGVVVQLLLDGGEAAGGKSLWRTLDGAGAQVRLWPTKKRGKLHAKFAILDGRVVLAGSANWTRKGLEENTEVIIRLTDEASVEVFESCFGRLWALGEPTGGRGADRRNPGDG
jgi:phosphatidylserine/phosphatidylglycerophosphate/cardiolipin synthase-like enzyme